MSASSTSVREELSASDALTNVRVSGDPGVESLSRLRYFLLGEAKPFACRIELLAGTGKVEQSAAHIGLSLLLEIVLP